MNKIDNTNEIKEQNVIDCKNYKSASNQTIL